MVRPQCREGKRRLERIDEQILSRIFSYISVGVMIPRVSQVID
jgi:hypothetical protein